MQKVIIFGIGKVSDVISYFLENFSDYKIIAYTVDEEYIFQNKFREKPVIPFKNLENLYIPSEYDVFVALGYQELNRLREKKCLEVKEKGYKLFSYIGNSSGISKDLIYKENCFVMDGALIHPKVEIGKNVFIWSGSMIGHHSYISDNCWLTSSSNISGGVNVGKNCFFAVNSTVANSLKIGKNCFFGANSLITKSVDDESVFIENSSNIYRLKSHQFLKLSQFNDI